MDIDTIKCLALDNGWEVVWEKPDNPLVRFARPDERNPMIDVWYTTGTVGVQRLDAWGHYRLSGNDVHRECTEEDLTKLFTSI